MAVADERLGHDLDGVLFIGVDALGVGGERGADRVSDIHSLARSAQTRAEQGTQLLVVCAAAGAKRLRCCCCSARAAPLHRRAAPRASMRASARRSTPIRNASPFLLRPSCCLTSCPSLAIFLISVISFFSWFCSPMRSRSSSRMALSSMRLFSRRISVLLCVQRGV